MSKVSCEIIKDLLPLYYDKVCSVESNKMVKEHLDECSSCKSELDRIEEDIKLPKETIESNRSEGNVIKDIADKWNRSKVKAFARGLIYATVLFAVIFLCYMGLYKWTIISVPTDVVKISEVSLLADGRIAYHVELTDRCELTRVKYDMDEDGNFYETPLRPVIKKTNQNMIGGLGNCYDFFDIKAQQVNHDGAQIKALYYGTPKDNILIWKKGMSLQRASEKVEAELKLTNKYIQSNQ